MCKGFCVRPEIRPRELTQVQNLGQSGVIIWGSAKCYMYISQVSFSDATANLTYSVLQAHMRCGGQPLLNLAHTSVLRPHMRCICLRIMCCCRLTGGVEAGHYKI